MNRFTKHAIATGTFLTALGGTLLLFPMMLDNQAFALDTGTAPSSRTDHAMRLPSERIEPMLAYLKTALKITDAQAKQWDAFADVLRKQAKARDAKILAMRSARATDPTAIDMMQHRAKALEDAAAAMSERLAAAKPLYAVLSDDQKQIADAMLGHFGRHGFRHGFGHHDGSIPG